MTSSKLVSLIGAFILSSHAAALAGVNQMMWANDPAIFDWLGVEIPEESDWVIRVYKTADGTIDFSDGSPRSDDVWTGIEFGWNSGGAPGFAAWIVHDVDIDYGLLAGDKCYSVLFNDTSASAATRYAVIDDSPTTVVFGPVGFEYWLYLGGAVADDWRTIHVPTPYEVWASGRGLSGGDAAEAADPDGDGIPNLMEFALAGNPTDADRTILPAAHLLGSGTLGLTFRRGTSDLKYTVESSTTLDAGFWAEERVIEKDSDPVTVGQDLTIEVGMGGALRKFLRLSVSE